MGVPGFFIWLIKKYKKEQFFFNIKNNKIINVDAIYFDTNCLLHPQCFKILAENSKLTDKIKLENKMIEECVKYLNHIIEATNPSKLIYISIDGVAPTSKIKQQRMRRFKSVKTKVLYNNIKKKHKKEIGVDWNNSAITPGTEFMKKITARIIEFCKTSIHRKKIIFSSANTPGEGEHKILQYIRNNNTKDMTNVIYGLDADLIFLALSLDHENVYLLREADQLNQSKTDELLYVSIDKLKQCIFTEFKSLLDNSEKLSKTSVIRDFIFICYFLGNDFLPHIPSIDIKCYSRNVINGLDLLIRAYCHVYNNIEENIILLEDDDINYNQQFLQMFLEYLSSFENDFFVQLYNNKNKNYYKCRSNDPYEREIYKIENLKFKINNNIKLGKDSSNEWKYRYYSTYYHCQDNQEENINYACRKYFEGLAWVAKYYFKKCSSWEWYFPYDHAPFISDLGTFLKKININKFDFNLGKPLKPVVQLLSVLPPQSSYLLPHKYRYLMLKDISPIINLYPCDYKLDMLYKRKYWQCIPILPDLDIDEIKNSIKKIKQDETDTNMNKIIDDYTF